MESNQSLQFDSKKIFLYIQKVEGDLDIIRRFNKQLDKYEKSSADNIIKISEDKNSILSKIHDQELRKSFQTLSFLDQEKEGSDRTVGMINQRLLPLITKCTNSLDEIKKRVNELERKNKGKQLKDSEVKSFREDFLKQIMEQKKAIAGMITRESEWYLKQNCCLLQNLTKLMKKNNPVNNASQRLEDKNEKISTSKEKKKETKQEK